MWVLETAAAMARNGHWCLMSPYLRVLRESLFLPIFSNRVNLAGVCPIIAPRSSVATALCQIAHATHLIVILADTIATARFVRYAASTSPILVEGSTATLARNSRIIPHWCRDA